MLAAGVAVAQVPASADPARVAPRSTLTPPPSEAVKPAAPARQADSALTEEEARRTVLLDSLVIDGMTAYPIETVTAPYASLIGTRVTWATIHAIAQDLQQRYWDDGYALTRVTMPPPRDGIVRLQVVEGYVAEVETKNADPSDRVIRDAVRRLKNLNPLNVKKLERILLILNDMPGTRLSAVLASPKMENPPPGALRLILEKGEAPRLWGSVGIHNHGSRYAGPWQGSGNVSAARVFLPHDSLSFATAVAQPLSELAYGSLRYTLPVCGASGTVLSLAGTFSRNAPGLDLKALEVKGRAHELALGISYPVMRQRDRMWQVEGGFAVKGAYTDLSGGRLYDDRLRVFSLGTRFVQADTAQGVNSLELGFAQGLDILGVRRSGSADLSRAAGRTDFTKITAGFSREQALPRNFALRVMAEGQYTADPLLSGEEFGFGGSRLGRGYDPSEITGDRGVAFGVELRHHHPVAVGRLQPYVFYEIGKVWNIDPGARDKVSAASSGVGSRFFHQKGWNADLNLAVPLTKPAAHPPAYSAEKGVRVLFSLGVDF